MHQNLLSTILDKINLKFILNHQLIRSSNNTGYEIVKTISKIIKINKDKKIK